MNYWREGYYLNDNPSLLFLLSQRIDTLPPLGVEVSKYLLRLLLYHYRRTPPTFRTLQIWDGVEALPALLR
jgi:hypothetical protein